MTTILLSEGASSSRLVSYCQCYIEANMLSQVKKYKTQDYLNFIVFRKFT